MPVVPIANHSLTQMRTQMTVLLLAVLAFPTAGVIQDDVQYELVDKAMDVFAASLIAKGHRSLELVQALLVASFWFLARPRSKYTSFDQLIRLTISAALDIGLGGPDNPPGVQAAGLVPVDDPSSLDGRRAWLVCFLATSGVALVMRRAEGNIWTKYHDECLYVLGSSPLAFPTDRLLCQVVQAEKLCNRIGTRLGLFDPSGFWDVCHDGSKQQVSVFRQELDLWTEQIPVDVQGSTLDIWRCTSLILLNEPILHTSTNKLSFSAPYLADKMLPADFAAPIVTVDHVAALYVLKDACHTTLDLFLAMDTGVVLGQSSLLFIPRMRYALTVLLKLYIALTAPGNSYGNVLGRNELKLEDYFSRMHPFAAALRSADPDSFNTRIIASYTWLEEWFVDYKSIVARYEEDIGRPTNLYAETGKGFWDEDWTVDSSDKISVFSMFGEQPTDECTGAGA
ncbi:hypothetical protein LTR37_008030 [Vermiconidia calcicola]|uniref:Uncharacterized protein n=1 Tax=Vermiconidia calcicola TaxID=1690605 RepID=A0ACC3NC46_9PEZI|nr:hypothetical protein LTR37_008030 [Vermiconidia calcicola]